MTKRAVLLLIVFLLIIIGLLPILVMLIKSITQDGHLTLAFYQILFTQHEWVLIRNSFTLSLLTMSFSLMIGLPLGILLVKTDLPFRRFFTVLFAIPLLIPPYITAISWFDLMGSNEILAQVTTQWLFGLPGCVFVLSSTFLPIVLLITMIYVRMVNTHLEEAGKL